MRYFDAFAGLGGFALPLREAGHECAGFSEIDRWAVSVYRRHFPSHQSFGDITAIDAPTLPDFDLLTGGVPCQSWSQAGKRQGFRDARGGMWWHFARLLRVKQPRCFLAENVKGLLSHDGGASMARICKALCAAGYGIVFAVLNSKDFGVPQNRERVFVVGVRKDVPERGWQTETPLLPDRSVDRLKLRLAREGVRFRAFPFGRLKRAPRVTLTDVLEREADPKYSLSPKAVAGLLRRLNEQRTRGNGFGPRFSPAVAGALAERDWRGGRDIIVQRPCGKNPGGVRADGLAPAVQLGLGDGNVCVLSQNQRREVRSRSIAGAPTASRSATQFQAVAIRGRGDGATPEARDDGVSNALRTASGGGSRALVMYPGHAVNERLEVARTLKAGVHGLPGGEGLVRSGATIRRLTPAECERLQALPAGWTASGTDESGTTVPISDSRRYRLLGNAVTTTVVAAILDYLPDEAQGQAA